jgi:hypothetical protein
VEIAPARARIKCNPYGALNRLGPALGFRDHSLENDKPKDGVQCKPERRKVGLVPSLGADGLALSLIEKGGWAKASITLFAFLVFSIRLPPSPMRL